MMVQLLFSGCNEHCTYCVVPGVRGKEQSREPEAIKKEMIALGAAGYVQSRREVRGDAHMSPRG